MPDSTGLWSLKPDQCVSSKIIASPDDMTCNERSLTWEPIRQPNPLNAKKLHEIAERVSSEMNNGVDFAQAMWEVGSRFTMNI